ncbi:MAG: hypothetical protein A2161_03540 [Candidatus Schekmanbacteria bacterium RBG_13_48_7]|uniref:Glycosyl transferase family 1 domain-containing protein n=1 Tax=Candidatus Schekmanbacteria bacterium RBG_13_48_7 TaxID=1817878 RepID=A0A1F7S7T2_9BACT|nr:MAG: hypothetical protein A2161_03540 [Candidatus Schekmanbacteria bacterium RBG_13_48_7]
MSETLKKAGVDLYSIPFDKFRGIKCFRTIPGSIFRFIKLVVSLIRFCKKNKINILYANEIKVALLAGITGKILSIPVIWHAHDFTTHGKIDSLCYRWSSRIITVSNAVRARFRNFPDHKSKTCVIHNGISAEWYQNRENSEKLLDRHLSASDVIRIGMAGRLAPEKCQDLFITIFHFLTKTSSFPLAGFIAGESGDESLIPYRNELKNQIIKNGLENKLFLLGHIDHLITFLDEIDIFVLPSKREPFGLVTLEAMAREKPIVAFRTGGTPDIIEDGVTGFLFPDGDWKSMAEGIKRLINDPELRVKIGKNAKHHVEQNFTLEKSMESILAVCKNLVNL